VLEVEVWRETELKRTIVVAPDGKVTFPLAGSIDVADKTVQQVADLLRDRLKTVLAEPFVVVTLAESKSARVHVMGEVGRQGPIPFRDRMSVAQALAESGIIWGTAKTEDVVVLRGALESPSVIEVDLDDVIDGKAKDVYLRPGDLVILPPKGVTRFDRYVRQLLSPITALTGAAREGVGAAAGAP